MMFCGNSLLAVNFIVMIYFKVTYSSFCYVVPQTLSYERIRSQYVFKNVQEKDTFLLPDQQDISNNEHIHKSRLNTVKRTMRSKRGLK